jgi:hypothetical protein
VDLLVGLLLLFCVFLWIVIDNRVMLRRMREPATEEEKARARSLVERRWSPQKLAAIGLALMCWGMALYHLAEQPKPPFSGRLDTLYTLLYGAFGPAGIAAFWAALGTIGAACTWTYKKQ